jgi:transcription initiation factor TFIIIB Brf1 subunit/transcription initiation factor TFIIB
MRDTEAMERISFDNLLDTAEIIWSNKITVHEVAADAYSILTKVQGRKTTFCSGRRATALVGGLFYLLGFRYNDVKKQNELACKLGTTDVTIRKSYRAWLISFPDLFADIIGKLAQHESLRYFVLLELLQAKQAC